VVRVTTRDSHCDEVPVEYLKLDAQFLQPPPVQKHVVGQFYDPPALHTC
jgi:hypothetical protein